MLHEDFQFLLNFWGDLGAGGVFISAALEVAEVFECPNRDGDRPDPIPLLRKGFIGALIAFLSFGAVMLATRLDKVGEAAALRRYRLS